MRAAFKKAALKMDAIQQKAEINSRKDFATKCFKSYGKPDIPKPCGNRKIKKNVVENRKKHFFPVESRKRTPYYTPSKLLCQKPIQLDFLNSLLHCSYD